MNVMKIVTASPICIMNLFFKLMERVCWEPWGFPIRKVEKPRDLIGAFQHTAASATRTFEIHVVTIRTESFDDLRWE